MLIKGANKQNPHSYERKEVVPNGSERVVRTPDYPPLSVETLGG
jgi:hypothetical protein